MNAIICDRCNICLAVSSESTVAATSGTVWFRVTVHNEPFDLCRGCTDYIRAFLKMEDGLPTVAEDHALRFAGD